MNQTLEHVLLVEKWRRLQILYCQLKHKESKTELLSFLQLFICKKRSWKNYLDIVFYKVSSYFLKEWRGFSVNWHNCFWDLTGKFCISAIEFWRNLTKLFWNLPLSTERQQFEFLSQVVLILCWNCIEFSSTYPIFLLAILFISKTRK